MTNSKGQLFSIQLAKFLADKRHECQNLIQGHFKKCIAILFTKAFVGPDQKTVTFCNGPHILCQVSSLIYFFLNHHQQHQHQRRNHHHHHHHHHDHDHNINRKRQTDSSDEEEANRGRGQEALEFSQAQVIIVIIIIMTRKMMRGRRRMINDYDDHVYDGEGPRGPRVLPGPGRHHQYHHHDDDNDDDEVDEDDHDYDEGHHVHDEKGLRGLRVLPGPGR